MFSIVIIKLRENLRSYVNRGIASNESVKAFRYFRQRARRGVSSLLKRIIRTP